MIQAERIADVMGGAEVFQHAVGTLGELAREVEHGLPKRSVREVGRHLFSGDREITREFIYRLIPEASYKRRKERLTSEESARVERIARVVATAEFVWDDEAAARRFLLGGNPMLEGRTPLDVAMSEIGARRVEALLWDIFYGHPA
ncbi:antitoxin Xre/MbcA/ParS toxin-binding domain-containing protein [Endothiovibrio diazotrophicus]